MAISKVDFWFFIIELDTRNPNLGIPALEDGLFANSLIFDYLYYARILFNSLVYGDGSTNPNTNAKMIRLQSFP